MRPDRDSVCVIPSLISEPTKVHFSNPIPTAIRVHSQRPILDNIFCYVGHRKRPAICKPTQKRILQLGAIRLNIGRRIPELRGRTREKN